MAETFSDPLVPLPAFETHEMGDSAEVASLLMHVRDMSDNIRRAQREVRDYGESRSQAVTRLKELGVPITKIAKWSGTTHQALNKGKTR